MTEGPLPEEIPSSPCMPCNIVHIHVDADRDGTVDDAPGAPVWSFGAAARGAIICVNCDHDSGSSSVDGVDDRDINDTTVNGAADLREVAPLELRKASKLPLDGARVVLYIETDQRENIRIFDDHSAGASEIIGPTTGFEKTFTEADFDGEGRIRLGMEALKFPTKNVGGGTVDFDGEIRLNLRVQMPDGSIIHNESVPVRVAPWLVFNHTNITETVYVCAISEGRIIDNAYFVGELKKIVGGKLDVIPMAWTLGDRWAQDIMELGFSNWPGKQSMVTAIRTPRWRPQASDYFAQYPGAKLLGSDFGYYESNIPAKGSSLDSFGNLECSPPIPGYPFGRIVYGDPMGRKGHRPMMPEMRDLLDGQVIQSPIVLDTGWLVVGHVDEYMSFIPDASGTHGFKIAFASPSKAMEIIEANPRAELFKGIRKSDGSEISLTNAEIELERQNLGHIGTYSNFRTSAQILASSEFKTLQDQIQSILTTQQETLMRELGIAESDFIHLPVLFRTDAPGTLTYCVAHTGGSVNMLVVTNSAANIDLIIPKPFGPMIGEECQFEKEIMSAFSSNATVKPHFVDCFLPYHVNSGEIHCATNSKRIPPETPWWHR